MTSANAAARLEAANKELGSAICIGPVAASRLDPSTLRPLGRIGVRGRGEDLMAVYEPWPPGMAPEVRARYLAAFASIDGVPERAIELFEALARECPTDPVCGATAQRLRAQSQCASDQIRSPY